MSQGVQNFVEKGHKIYFGLVRGPQVKKKYSKWYTEWLNYFIFQFIFLPIIIFISINSKVVSHKLYLTQ